MITFELFERTLNQIKEDNERAKKLNEIFHKDDQDEFGYSFTNEPLTALTVELLDKNFYNDCDWVYYWVYELECGTKPHLIKINGDFYKMDSPKALYDCIYIEMEDMLRNKYD